MRFRHATCFIALIAAAQLACVTPRDPGIEALVRSATTPVDHREIAEYYRVQAAATRDAVAEHRRLAELYGSRLNWGVAFADHQSDHCDQLATSQHEVAAQYELLAVEHERLANE